MLGLRPVGREDTAGAEPPSRGHCGLAGWRSPAQTSGFLTVAGAGSDSRHRGSLFLASLPPSPQPRLCRSPCLAPQPAPVFINKGSHHLFSDLRGVTQIPQLLLSTRQTQTHLIFITNRQVGPLWGLELERLSGWQVPRGGWPGRARAGLDGGPAPGWERWVTAARHTQEGAHADTAFLTSHF